MMADLVHRHFVQEAYSYSQKVFEDSELNDKHLNGITLIPLACMPACCVFTQNLFVFVHKQRTELAFVLNIVFKI